MNELAREEAALAAALRWTTAATQADEAAARAATTEEDWGRGEDRLSDLFGQVSRKGLVIEPLGLAHTAGPRAAQHAVLSRAGLGRPLGDLFLLLREGPGGWQLCGATKVRPQVALFLSGQVEAHDGPERLPPDEAALRWATLLLIEQHLGGAAERAALPAELERALSQGPGLALRTVGVPGTGRSAVELRFGDGDEAWQGWVLLQAGDGGLSPIDARARLRYEPLLRGIELAWPTEAGQALEASPALDAQALEAHIRQTFTDAFAEADAALGEAPADDPRRIAPQRVLELLDAALQASLAAPPRAPRPLQLAEAAPAAAAPPLTMAVAVADARPASPPLAAEPTVQNDVPEVNPAASAAPSPGSTGPEAPSAAGSGAPEAPSAPPPGPVPITLPPRMQEAMGQIFTAAGGAEGQTIDAAFLQQHGGEVVGGLLRGFLQEVLPPTLELDVTVPKPSADGQSVGQAPAKVKVDLGSILGGLFKPRPPAAAPKPEGEA